MHRTRRLSLSATRDRLSLNANVRSKMKKLTAILILLCALQCGCASIASLRATPHEPQGLSQYPRYVYGGVRDDWRNIDKALPGPSWVYPIVGLYVVDMPFSAIIDTVALPFTIPYNLIQNDERTSNKRPEATGETPSPQP